jgi:hypothetical protein
MATVRAIRELAIKNDDSDLKSQIDYLLSKKLITEDDDEIRIWESESSPDFVEEMPIEFGKKESRKVCSCVPIEFLIRSKGN